MAVKKAYRPSIKFSHRYKKLVHPSGHGCVDEAYLIEVLPVKRTALNMNLLDVDTSYFNKNGTTGHYDFKETMDDMLMLIFVKVPTVGYNLFTTLRSAMDGKYEYYSGLIGKKFDIIYPEKGVK